MPAIERTLVLSYEKLPHETTMPIPVCHGSEMYINCSLQFNTWFIAPVPRHDSGITYMVMVIHRNYIYIRCYTFILHIDNGTIKLCIGGAT